MPAPLRERDLFEQALDLPTPSDRARFLARACGPDHALRARILRLLEAHESGGRFLGGPDRTPRVASPGEPEQANPGVDESGRYRLLERIGEGGFGYVYLAEQHEPVKRRVALKILKPGMDTRQIVARFEAERQALALMDHPGIARIFDGGVTTAHGLPLPDHDEPLPAGRPYFVMEWVPGLPITGYCDTHRLDLRQRLDLFAEVCAAVHHAHQKGIIHRDLKPSNILVVRQDDRPVPKVIDFGIAKAVEDDSSVPADRTRLHEFIGTPAYMSPEQARFGARDVDTRSDIYSLGVLLHELLVGRTPFDLDPAPLADPIELRRRLLEDEPVRPSSHLASLPPPERARIAERRQSDPETLRRRLRGDLDWIILRCLAKDRTGRYESASALAQDLHRNLDHRPVKAASPRAGYRAAKFVRRHRVGLAVATAFVLLLVGASVTSTVLALRAFRAERIARTEAAVTEAVNRFLNEDLLAQADPEAEPDREIRLRTLLDRAARVVDTRFADDPRIGAALHATIGQAFVGLGEYPSAEPHLRRAHQLLGDSLGASHPRTIRALSDLALLKSRQGEHAAARLLGAEAVELATGSVGRRHALTVKCLGRLAEARLMGGDTQGAAEAASEAIASCRSPSDVDPVDHGHLLQTWGRVLGRHGDAATGEARMRDGYQLLATRLGEGHPQTLIARGRFGAYLYDHRRNLDQAEALYSGGLELARRTLGEAHVRTRIFRWNLMLLYHYRFGDRPAHALHHLLHLLEFVPGQPTADQMRHLRLLLDGAPPSLPPRLDSENPGRWRGSTRPPPDAWTDPEFEPTRWPVLEQADASELWLRRSFQLARVPAERVFVVALSSADLEVFLDGIPVTTKPLARLDRFQLAFLEPRALAALRPGTNVLAVHGRGWVPGESLSIGLYSIPPLPGATP